MQNENEINNLKNYDPTEVDAVIVGAGPAGLLNAIGLLKKDPNRKIVILEKREEYSRNHVVRLKHEMLSKFIAACGGEDDPILSGLVERLKRNPAIRTNELEGILKGLAIDLGAEIKYGEVKDVQTQVFDAYPNVELVIGADGTHSTVSEQVFGEENQEKHEFDYVLQLRFEVEGEDVKKIDLPTWPKYLQAYGMTGEEVIGTPRNGKTPITMQIMVSKEDFDALQPYATSKNPIRPFNDEDKNTDKVPPTILSKIKGYLGLRLRYYTDDTQILDMSDVRISVNEAPATRAKSIIKYVEKDGRKICVALAGDAALGLSYFKGLNACFENTAHALDAFTSDSLEREERIGIYSTWFDEEYAPKKVNEVAQYSKYGIRLPLSIISFLNRILGSDLTMNTKEAERYTDLYHGYQRGISKGEENPDLPWNPYPHRPNYWIQVLDFIPTPPSKRFLEMGKYFVNFFQSYKSPHYLIQDFIQPFRALYQLAVGGSKILFALPIFIVTSLVDLFSAKTWKAGFSQIGSNFITALTRIVDGFAQLMLGGVLAATTILEPLRIITRSLATIFEKSVPKIEDNRGMKNLIEKTKEENLNNNQLNSLSIDMHRKFSKSLEKGQATSISIEAENKAFRECKLGEPETYKRYFDLFNGQEKAGLEGDEDLLTQVARSRLKKSEKTETTVEKIEKNRFEQVKKEYVENRLAEKTVEGLKTICASYKNDLLHYRQELLEKNGIEYFIQQNNTEEAIRLIVKLEKGLEKENIPFVQKVDNFQKEINKTNPVTHEKENIKILKEAYKEQPRTFLGLGDKKMSTSSFLKKIDETLQSPEEKEKIQQNIEALDFTRRMR